MSDYKSSNIEINYRKIRPLNLADLAQQYEPSEEDIANHYNQFSVSEIQTFNPIYTDFFRLNESNYNRIGLNHRYYLEGSSITSESVKTDKTYHVKCSPLLDPIHYLVGKYKQENNLRILPSLTNCEQTHPKIANKQNASYIDGFFSFLSSKLKHQHNMLNAVDFYGSYLAIQKVFKATITDDLDYLNQSNYFTEHIGKGVAIYCGTNANMFDDFTGIGSRTNKKPLVFQEELRGTDIDIVELVVPGSEETPAEIEQISCEYVQTQKYESESDSDSSESDSESEQDIEEKVENDSDNKSSQSEYDDSQSNASSQSEYDDSQSDSQADSQSDSSSLEQDAYAYIDNFPANLIFLEKCDGTLDSLFLRNEIDETFGAAYLMQIIMSLIAFQKAFHFTHNDLHTNNIMYINTEIEFLYYKYNNQFYRVPTYGKIFKLIDFGRAIYRFKDKIYCSDSFAPKGDAHSQYNTEPYLNENRPRVEPNLSFDLCRLGTSIYDFIIPDEDEPRDAFQETIYRWCLDDAGRNIMYRRDGEERYPGFKLYKMIARNVHTCLPQDQLKYPIFSQFLVNPLDATKFSHETPSGRFYSAPLGESFNSYALTSVMSSLRNCPIDEQEVRKYGLNIDLMEKEYI